MSTKSRNTMNRRLGLPELLRTLHRTSRGCNPKRIRAHKAIGDVWLESRAEQQCALVLEYRKDVKCYITNPMTLVRHYECPRTLKKKTASYTADFLVDFIDGRRELWEIKASKDHALKAETLAQSFQEQALHHADELVVKAVDDLANRTMLYNLERLSIYNLGFSEVDKWNQEKFNFGKSLAFHELKRRLLELGFSKESIYQAIWNQLATFDLGAEELNTETMLVISP